jgi:hypothetical protein
MRTHTIDRVNTGPIFTPREAGLSLSLSPHLGDEVGKASEVERSQRSVDGLDDGLEQLDRVAAILAHGPGQPITVTLLLYFLGRVIE